MDFLDRINAVLHHEKPDQVPFAPYDILIPQGSFERQLKNRGMGLVARCPAFWKEQPNVRVETVMKGDVEATTYHTPEGSVSTRRRMYQSRQHGGGRSVQLEGLIKRVADFDPVLFMIGDTVYHADEAPYEYKKRDLGRDGIVRVSGGGGPPYDAAIGQFGHASAEGIENWVYLQADYPDHFAKLLEACERDTEAALLLLGASPAEFVAFGSISGFYGPGQFKEHVLPSYKKAIPYLHSKGKICSMHAHAPQLASFRELIKETGIDVVEAFTPPPFADLSVAEAREAWGSETVIWVNFPDTIFHSGAEATKQYAIDLLRSDPPGGSLVIGFTETGLGNIVDDEEERIFKAGFIAIMEAIEEFGNYPVH